MTETKVINNSNHTEANNGEDILEKHKDNVNLLHDQIILDRTQLNNTSINKSKIVTSTGNDNILILFITQLKGEIITSQTVIQAYQ